MTAKRQARNKAKARRHTQRQARPKNAQRQKLTAGEARVTAVESTDGLYTRVTIEYQSHSREQDNGMVGQALAAEMVGAARSADTRILATQRPTDVVEGEILNPQCSIVLTRWIPVEKELLILSARGATLEDIATLDRFGEKTIEETEARKAEARRLIEARDADQVNLPEDEGIGEAAAGSILALAESQQ